MTASLAEERDVSAAASVPNPVVLALKELKSGREWTLTLHPEHLALRGSAEAQPYVILRQQLMKSAALAEGMRGFVLKQPFQATFRLTRDGMTALADWVGKPVLARHYLKSRCSFLLPVAVLWMLGSMPLPADDAAGLAATPADSFGLVLGILLAGIWACAKWRPHPLLFLIDSIWFLALSAHVVTGVATGRSGMGWLALVPVSLWIAAKGVSYFRRFYSTSISKEMN